MNDTIQTIENLKFVVDSLAAAHPGLQVRFIYPSPTPKRDERTLVGRFGGYKVKLTQSGDYDFIDISVTQRY